MAEYFKDLGDGRLAQVTTIADVEVAIPMDIQARYSQTIQVLNAQVAATGATLTSAWQKVDWAGDIAVTCYCEADISYDLYFEWSNDGTNVHGSELLVTGNSRYAQDKQEKVADWVRVKVVNNDYASHTFNSWINPQA